MTRAQSTLPRTHTDALASALSPLLPSSAKCPRREMSFSLCSPSIMYGLRGWPCLYRVPRSLVLPVLILFSFPDASPALPPLHPLHKPARLEARFLFCLPLPLCSRTTT